MTQVRRVGAASQMGLHRLLGLNTRVNTEMNWCQTVIQSSRTRTLLRQHACAREVTRVVCM